jgi:hypothetical protein
VADVFISYHHSDRDLARRLADGLSAAGASVWWDRELIGGADFDSTILRELSAAACVIVLWTDDSIRSVYVRDEAKVALDQNKLIPVASEEVEPPLGFRRLHLLHIGSVGPEDVGFFRMLKRAVEARIDRTLQMPVRTEPKMDAASDPSTSLTARVIVPLGADFGTIATGAGCVWLSNSNVIEVRGSRDGSLLGRSKTNADALLGSTDGESVISLGFGIGYQSPGTISMDRWKLKGSPDETRERIRRAGAEPEDWYSSRDSMVEHALSDSIIEMNLLHTWAWQLGPADLSEDGSRIAAFVDYPDKRIQVWSTDDATKPIGSIALGRHYPLAIAFLAGGSDLVMLELRGADKVNSVSLWHISSGECVAEHELEYMNVNAICRTANPWQVVLGLDQSIAALNVERGTIETQVEIESRPIRKCVFDPQGKRIGVVTDQQLVVIDDSTMQVSQEIQHNAVKGLDCGLRGNDMAALVTAEDEEGKLVLWNLATGD